MDFTLARDPSIDPPRATDDYELSRSQRLFRVAQAKTVVSSSSPAQTDLDFRRTPQILLVDHVVL